ncbi:hypothetical protein FA95DRAFT_966353 [Auriscalpium vulgare]|uniref:Uncharacterized protein n=1 Tax=Auriscalpium vulgare TaxID=40419 RepID=A0ACB8R8G4_9AGAM|nr:hypothetical protein FA95DRAFT_966353 [Auriscalpium vulgare]
MLLPMCAESRGAQPLTTLTVSCTHEGLAETTLKHPLHHPFRATQMRRPPARRASSARWHIDAALFRLALHKMTTLYGTTVAQTALMVCCYDGLPMPLITAAIISRCAQCSTSSDLPAYVF